MLNKVQLIGRLGKDPELRTTQSNTSVCSFSIATTDKYKNKEGEWVENTEWHNIVTWANLADICAKYLQKGKQVYIEGKLQTRKWQDKDGADRYTTEIVANEMKMLGSRSDDQEGYAPAPTASGQPDNDDDLPF
jgi:single-strand DNA-binding protein